MKRRKKQKYIKWTDEEKTRLVLETKEVFLKFKNKLTVLYCFNVAQQRVLANSRMRKINNVKKIPWFQEYLEKGDSINPIRLAFKKEFNSNNQEYNNEQELLNNIRKIISEEVENRLPFIIESKLKQLNIAETIVEYLEEDLSNIKFEIQSRENKKEEEIIKNKPVVVLINLLPEQFQIIEKVYGDQLDFISWRSTDDSIDKLKSYCSKAHRIYAMTDKMGHNTDEIIIKVNKPAYRRFTGSTSSLKRIISEDLRTGVFKCLDN